MEKFIPYEKLSKKEKRKLDQAKRHFDFHCFMPGLRP